MIGRTWPAEGRTFQDPQSGRIIRQLTTKGNNVHLYFTENAFDARAHTIIFTSDRSAAEDRAPHESPHYNIFQMNLDSGMSTQLTDEAESVGRVTKTPDSQLIAYSVGRQIKILNTQTGENRVVYTETGNYTLGGPSISANRRYLGFARNEDVSIDHGPNYGGFKSRFYDIKDGRITIAYLDGSGWFDAFKDTHQLSHFQFSPDDGTIAMFCHEGPWNLVTQRMWSLDVASRNVWPLHRQAANDSIGHEFWTHNGLIFFDNRGPGHDGTITSDLTQAVATAVAVNENEFSPYVGLVDRYDNLISKIDMPYYCNHYHAHPNNTVLVGDDVDKLVLIDIAGKTATLEVLCEHKTSWYTQSSHCHPTWSWDGKKILFASDEGGKVQLYLIEL
ncbi:MAG: hypothetical protein GFH27_549293n179 [Chloroflexi bacterium AL-W]|nr:hypothetical protein [Chloroflexi bacterium AL-N1]NOK67706.1 hypothetical protein [Chloroflexi bacterium AL-N10]NOK75524.1 hypothetical protein [Chloroflexi bacterium AL-N5]NOK82312.1 hypothetical protein [Chloroflexi bacterium AL-W]NOK90157.1 hypothetical protein [Chloroflexi bacterium AL-N15]